MSFTTQVLNVGGIKLGDTKLISPNAKISRHTVSLIDYAATILTVKHSRQIMVETSIPPNTSSIGVVSFLADFNNSI